jgi:hypothetical protein
VLRNLAFSNFSLVSLSRQQVGVCLPRQSSVESTFWYELANNKLEKYRLNEAPAPIQGAPASRYLLETAGLGSRLLSIISGVDEYCRNSPCGGTQGEQHSNFYR